MQKHSDLFLMICIAKMPNSVCPPAWVSSANPLTAPGTRPIIDGMPTQPGPSELSLYKRLGGYDAIAAVIADMFGLMRADPRFSRFNQGRSIDSKMRAQQLTVEQMCALSGGPCVYLGRDMKTSHAGLGITEQEWDATMEFTKAALKRNNIPARELQEFLDIFQRYHGDIVETPNAK